MTETSAHQPTNGTTNAATTAATNSRSPADGFVEHRIAQRRMRVRTRMMIAMVVVTSAALAVAGIGTYEIVNRSELRSARSTITTKFSNLRTAAGPLLDELNVLNGFNRRNGQQRAPGARLKAVAALRELRATTKVSDARLVFIRQGHIVEYRELIQAPVGRLIAGDDPDAQALLSLPNDLPVAKLDLVGLIGGSTQTIRVAGSMYVVGRLSPTAASSSSRSTPIIVISQAVDRKAARRAIDAFLVSALVALVLCLGLSAWLARRLTKPLISINDAARELATGNLGARVSLDGRADREIADVGVALNNMARDLEQARGAERAFLQAVSHDLRTPLTSIRGYAEALGDGTVDMSDPATRDRVASILTTESTRLERLVRDLLDLSRLESKEFVLHPRQCDPLTIVRDVVDGFVPDATARGIALTYTSQSPAVTPSLANNLDPDRLGQAVANLVENALTFARHSVHVAFEQSNNTATIAVIDDGTGIETDNQRKVFERLYTARNAVVNDPSSRPLGTGLGLAIVHELAHLMGGSCRLTDSSPAGTTFTLTIAT